MFGGAFPQDVRLKEEAERILKEISEFSPAYELYKDLKEYAEQNIKRSIRNRESLED